jgi:hypothetical protein
VVLRRVTWAISLSTVSFSIMRPSSINCLFVIGIHCSLAAFFPLTAVMHGNVPGGRYSCTLPVSVTSWYFPFLIPDDTCRPSLGAKPTCHSQDGANK